MTDSVEVFPPGYRLTDSSTGAPLAGGAIYFYDAGTTTPKTVYSNKDLTTSLGTSVVTDALGYPTSDNVNKTLIYVGTSTYKVVIKNQAGSTIAEHDNVKGAVATVDPGSLSVQATSPVETKSLSYTVLSTDQNKVYAGNCTGGNVTFTLPSAVTVGTGWGVTIQHAGSANKVTVATVSSQTITHGATSLGTSTDLRFNGEEIKFISDGGNWRCSPRVQQFVPAGTIMIHAAATAPTGWLECNGAAISRTTYAGLFAVIGTTHGAGDASTTFNIPDLRGYFVRGSGTNGDGTASGTFAEKQTDAFKAHTHTYTYRGSNTQTFFNGGGITLDAADNNSATGTSDSTGGTETRPKNIALLYIIKV